MVFKEIEWKNYKGALLPIIPQHKSIVLTKTEQKELLKKSGVHLVRWITDWDTHQEMNYWYIIKDKFNGFEEYSTGTRNKVRKGFNNCDVKKINAEFLIQNGYEIYKSAYLNYQKKDVGIKSIPSKESFINYYRRIASISEFWGVFEKESNRLIAFAENVIRDGGVIYGAMKFDPSYMKKYPSYALIHVMNQYYLDELKMKYVSDGPRSLFHETNIQEMLIRVFNFRKAYCKLNIATSPILNIAVLIIYPFRRVIYYIKQRHFKELSVILKMIEIVRKDEKSISLF